MKTETMPDVGHNSNSHTGTFLTEPLKKVTHGSVKFVESILYLFFERPNVYKYNDESGQYEEYDPRAETKYDLPPRMF